MELQTATALLNGKLARWISEKCTFHTWNQGVLHFVVPPRLLISSTDHVEIVSVSGTPASIVTEFQTATFPINEKLARWISKSHSLHTEKEHASWTFRPLWVLLSAPPTRKNLLLLRKMSSNEGYAEFRTGGAPMNGIPAQWITKNRVVHIWKQAIPAFWFTGSPAKRYNDQVQPALANRVHQRPYREFQTATAP